MRVAILFGPELRVPIPILMYHEVVPDRELDAISGRTQSGYVVTLDTFERQMSWLAASGWHPVPLNALLDSSPVKEARPIVITFDDGFVGNHRHAWPVLQRHGFLATFFIVTNRVGEASMMSWSNLREMSASGMAIESHTANHPLLSTIDQPRTRSELSDSKRAIEDALGRPVQFVSLPNGDHNPHYVDAARAAGYAGGCCSEFGYNDSTTDRWFWRRIAVKRALRDDAFARLVSGDPRTVRAHLRAAMLKRAAVRTLGKRNYDRLYNFTFGVDEQDATRRASPSPSHSNRD